MMAERDDTVPVCRRLRLLMSVLRMLQGLPRMFMPRQVILLPLLRGDAVGMRGVVV